MSHPERSEPAVPHSGEAPLFLLLGVRSGVSSDVGNGVDLSDAEPEDGPKQGGRGSLGMSTGIWTMLGPCSMQSIAACPCVLIRIDFPGAYRVWVGSLS